ncbi:MAG: radical SAM protein [Candidatus Hydrothermarchaeales archaeon]
MWELPEGCKLCEKGEKLVLFVTGLCKRGCYYCPLSDKRRDKDRVWANERLIKTTKDVLKESSRMDAKGAGITGGEPMIRFRRTLEYVTFLKSAFGRDFHIHLYTACASEKEKLENLKKAGLDEIRFHALNDGLWNTIEKSVDVGIETGVEIPAIPGEEKLILDIVKRLKGFGGSFLNINELEFSETNAKFLKEKGHVLKDKLSYAVKGSEETAYKVLDSDIEFNVHYCSSFFKDAIQLKNRLFRTAKNTAKAYEEVTEEGLLFKGIIEVSSSDTAFGELKNIQQNLTKEFRIPENLLFLDKEKVRLETSVEIASFLSENYKPKGITLSVVEEYPTADRLETLKIPL